MYNPYNLPVKGNWKPENTPNFLGSDFNYLKQLLTNQRAGDPKKDIYRKTFQKQLGRSTGRAVKNINEQLAASGFKGAGANLIGDVYESEANATENFENNLLQNDTNLAQSALAQLLQMNQFEGNQNFSKYQSDVQQDQFQKSQDQQMKMFLEQMRFQRQSQPSWWEELLGGLLGAGSQIGSAAIIASDANLKENIKKVGNNGDINIYEFNYLGDNRKYRGVIAQQIEANHPDAVKEINGIKFVDYSKLGLSMEAL